MSIEISSSIIDAVGGDPTARNSSAIKASDVRLFGSLSSTNDNSSLFATALAQSPNGAIFIPSGRWPGNITITANDQKVFGAGKPRYDSTAVKLVGGTVLIGTVLTGAFSGIELGFFGVDQVSLPMTVIDGFRGGGGTASIGGTPTADLAAYWHDLAALGRGYNSGATGFDSRHAFLIQGGRNALLENLHAYHYGHGCAYRASEGVINNLYTEDTELSTLTFKGDSSSGQAQDSQYNRASNIYGRSTGNFSPKVVCESYVDRIVSDIVIDNVVLIGGNTDMHVRCTTDTTAGNTASTTRIKITNVTSINCAYSDRAMGFISVSDVTVANATVIGTAGFSYRATTSPTTKLIGCTSTNPGAGHTSGTFQVSEVNERFSGMDFVDNTTNPGGTRVGNVVSDAAVTWHRRAGGAETYFAWQGRSWNSQGFQFVGSPSANAKGAENFTRCSITFDALGRVGVGGTAVSPTVPTASLHLPPGVASASGAPLKFGPGSVLLTTVETLAFETDGTDLYFTNSAGVRKKLTQV